jgi:hypothetical protein
MSHTARFRDFAKLLYPYHPLFQGGPTELEIVGARSDMLVVQLPDGARRGVPAWMFEEEICAAVRHSPHPMVEVTALIEIVKVLELNGRELRSARDECTSPSQKLGNAEVAAHSSNSSIRKRRKQQAGPGREAVRVCRADSAVDRSGRRSDSQPSRRAP